MQLIYTKNHNIIDIDEIDTNLDCDFRKKSTMYTQSYSNANTKKNQCLVPICAVIDVENSKSVMLDSGLNMYE